jgi:hypothetical protein
VSRAEDLAVRERNPYPGGSRNKEGHGAGHPELVAPVACQPIEPASTRDETAPLQAPEADEGGPVSNVPSQGGGVRVATHQ